MKITVVLMCFVMNGLSALSASTIANCYANGGVYVNGVSCSATGSNPYVFSNSSASGSFFGGMSAYVWADGFLEDQSANISILDDLILTSTSVVTIDYDVSENGYSGASSAIGGVQMFDCYDYSCFGETTITLGPGTYSMSLYSYASDIGTTESSMSVSVMPPGVVPEPSTFWLLIGSLVPIVGASRKDPKFRAQ